MKTATAFQLIPLSVETKGEVISSNLDEFRGMVQAALSNINTSPETDEEFGQAQLDVNALKGAETNVTEAKAKALADAETLNALLSSLDDTGEEIRQVRLTLERTIANKRESIKGELIATAMDSLVCAKRMREPVFGRSVRDAIKGKRTLESMKKALDTITAIHNGVIERNRKTIESFMDGHGEELVYDKDELETKGPDFVEVELRRRFETKKAAEEKRRLTEEASKAKAVADAAKAAADAAKVAEPVAKQPETAPTSQPELPSQPRQGSAGWPAKQDKPTETQRSSDLADAEWQEYLATARAAFAPLREARLALKHQANIDRAMEFGTGINALWNVLKNGGAK